ncbi:malonate decarboxylase holo-ACP synthase [Trinickia diaoshuihuensis]|uniref:malonate decarboxylase holo-ACP synthase n=1 Tax=Trinickia diaoshuihuensis TaxID=2292265 RepID=UPI000E23FFC0|nr:malonate decarboxylase holo-ACP synthase [Trinickia diaoshuihuensis]
MSKRGMHEAMTFEAHDLVRLRALPPMADAPAWLLDAFALAPYAVVRRAQAPEGVVPVGFRGATRSHRYGAFLARDLIMSAYAPEQLLERKPCAQSAALKAFVALREIAESSLFDALVWGPTGSVGFELATAQRTVTAASDLDLLIRTPSPLDRGDALVLRERLTALESDLGLRIDAQLETPAGGIALAEWAQGKPRVMARSTNGPRLVENPWNIDCALSHEVAS